MVQDRCTISIIVEQEVVRILLNSDVADALD